MLSRALLLLMFAFGATANGQSLTEVPQHGVGIRAHYGFLFAHHPEMRHLMGRHFGSAEVFYQHTFSGNKSWHHHYNFPSWGISVLYYAFPNPALGNAHAVFPYLYLPLNKSQRINLNFIAGAGGAYLTNAYDRVENHKNIAMSTRLNVALRLGFEGQYRISPRLSANTGVYITHFSNGALKLPNLGINVFSAHVGMAYHFGPLVNRERVFEEWRYASGLSYSLFGGFGMKKVQVGQQNFNPAFSLQFLAEKRISRKVSLGLGADLNFNTSRQLQYEMRGPTEEVVSPLRAGLGGSAIYHFGQMQIVSQLGVYVLDQFSMDGMIYNRFGLRHYIGKNILANLTLRSHFGKADHVEAGFVYVFNQK
jgi:hypothetical protein